MASMLYYTGIITILSVCFAHPILCMDDGLGSSTRTISQATTTNASVQSGVIPYDTNKQSMNVKIQSDNTIVDQSTKHMSKIDKLTAILTKAAVDSSDESIKRLLDNVLNDLKKLQDMTLPQNSSISLICMKNKQGNLIDMSPVIKIHVIIPQSVMSEEDLHKKGKILTRKYMKSKDKDNNENLNSKYCISYNDGYKYMMTNNKPLIRISYNDEKDNITKEQGIAVSTTTVYMPLKVYHRIHKDITTNILKNNSYINPIYYKKTNQEIDCVGLVIINNILTIDDVQ